MQTKTIDPKEISVQSLHHYLLGAVAPRPIAFVSTVDADGQINLAPFSFFNVFSANPPIMIFSPARSGRDNTTKHTFDNVKAHAEVCINVVNYAMVQQMSLASTAYPKGVNEFEKAGLTAVASDVIQPPRVKESPVQFECKVNEVVELGQEGGAGNLVICEVVKIHVHEAVLNEKGNIDPEVIDLVGRNGGAFYTRAHGEALFEIPKPISSIGMGIDQLPAHIKNSKILSGNDLGKLGTIDQLPNPASIAEGADPTQVEYIAKGLLEQNKVMEAMEVLLSIKP